MEITPSTAESYVKKKPVLVNPFLANVPTKVSYILNSFSLKNVSRPIANITIISYLRK